MNTSPSYLMDTHVFYWHLEGGDKLPPSIQAILSQAQAGSAILVISHIVLAELFFLLQKYRQASRFARILNSIQNSPAFRIEPIVLEDILQLATFPEIPEMHDRLIAIQASRLGAPLLTKDRSIQASPQVESIW